MNFKHDHPRDYKAIVPPLLTRAYCTTPNTSHSHSKKIHTIRKPSIISKNQPNLDNTKVRFSESSASPPQFKGTEQLSVSTWDWEKKSCNICRQSGGLLETCEQTSPNIHLYLKRFLHLVSRLPGEHLCFCFFKNKGNQNFTLHLKNSFTFFIYSGKLGINNFLMVKKFCKVHLMSGLMSSNKYFVS